VSDKSKILLMTFFVLLFVGMFIGIGLNADNYEYFLSRRIPKVLAMVIAGVAVAQSSLVFQTITHNRILTPSIMGFDALYLLTQVAVVSIFGGFSAYAINEYVNFSITSSIMVVFSSILFGYYFASKDRNLMTLLLIGLVLGQIFTNIASFISMLMDPNEYALVQANMFASFNNINVDLVYLCLPLLLIISVVLFRLNRVLDIFWLDQDNAVSLGVDVKKITLIVMLLSASLIAISTALVGPIMFFGLLVTNVIREMMGSYRHHTLLVAVSLLAVCMLLLGQWMIEKIFHFETTLSVIINFIGGMYFLSMLYRNKVV
jgi:iron complex transport system permease protein